MNAIMTRYRWLIPAAAGLVIVGLGFELLPMTTARVAVILILLIQIFHESRKGHCQYLTSPLFLLGIMALVFFDLIPGFSEVLFGYKIILQNYAALYYGGDAERIIVMFGLSCIAVHSLIVFDLGTRPFTDEDAQRPLTRKFGIFVVIALVATLVNVGNFILQKFGGPHVQAIRSMVPPLLAYCVIYLTHHSLSASVRDKWLIAATIVLTIVGLFFILEGKKPFFIMVAGFLFWLRLQNLPLKKIVLLGAFSVLPAIALVQVSQMVRVPHASLLYDGPPQSTSMFARVLRTKIVTRQATTRFCLQNVINEHRNLPFLIESQTFWIKGLVPRALWPDKPNLSLGNLYAQRYCGYKPDKKFTTWALQSSSITLLGQPFINGGWIGLPLHGGILIVGLGVVVFLGRNPYSLKSVSAVAMLPWLIDFDQDFALYVANAVKFLLVMLPLIFLANRLSRDGPFD